MIDPACTQTGTVWPSVSSDQHRFHWIWTASQGLLFKKLIFIKFLLCRTSDIFWLKSMKKLDQSLLWRKCADCWPRVPESSSGRGVWGRDRGRDRGTPGHPTLVPSSPGTLDGMGVLTYDSLQDKKMKDTNKRVSRNLCFGKTELI